MKHILLYRLTMLLCGIMLFALPACVDERLYDDSPVGEGFSRVNATIDFKQFRDKSLGTRSNGAAYDGIRNLRVFVFDDRGTRLIRNTAISISDADSDDLTYDGDYIKSVRFNLDLPYGKYRIYAAANMAADWTGSDISSVDELKSVELEWLEPVQAGDTYEIGQNDQMLGCFDIDASGSGVGIADAVVTINKPSVSLKARLVRAASKVTVAYDGSDLKEGVKIFIKSVSLKRIPKYCYLGQDNSVNSVDSLITNGESITYFPGNENYNNDYPALLDKDHPFFPAKTGIDAEGNPTWTDEENPHSHTSPNSLFFYENLQGTGPDKSKVSDEEKNGLVDDAYNYKDKPYATYVEVEAYYESVNPERPGMSIICYRFMLGQNITTDYNARRNCHYKLTLHFNGFANEPDWRIDYVTFFGVSEPHAVNYQGKYFVPQKFTADQPNLGNDFSGENIISVSSYRYQTDAWNNRTPLTYKIELQDSSIEAYKNFTEIKAGDELQSDWLRSLSLVSTPQDTEAGLQKLKINYRNPYETRNINTLLKDSSNSISTTTDLAAKGSANSYIVSSRGTYTLPAVYGNSLDEKGNTNTSSYSGFSSADRGLSTFRNALNENISQASVIADIKSYQSNLPNITAKILWQDAEGLISSVSYSSTAYSGKGGLTFTIGDGIAEGNAVLALCADLPTKTYENSPNTTSGGSGSVLWSWHIWVTSQELVDRTLDLTNHDGNISTIMPINLGWCSNGGEIRYYDRHECQVKFTQIIGKDENGDDIYGLTQTVKIIQEPHTALPVGYNPFFQWGRKDPLIGGVRNASGEIENQTWWLNESGTLTETTDRPAFLNPSFFRQFWGWLPDGIWRDGAVWGLITQDNPDGINPNNRLPSTEALGRMIQNPAKLNNPRFSGFDAGKIVDGVLSGNKDGAINDEIYSNLWNEDKKTVYDPCPPGYMVSSVSTFTGFTQWGGSCTLIDYHAYSVTTANMLPEYQEHLMEFYTDGSTKLISTTFPILGYRDYDAGVIYEPNVIFVWENKDVDWTENIWIPDVIKNNPEIDTDKWILNNYASFMRAYRVNTTGYDLTGYVGVGRECFYATDACSVRPTRIK